MTNEERLDRIEHFTAGIAEERRKDREEYKALWRDTERQIYEFGVGFGRATATGLGTGSRNPPPVSGAGR